MKKEKAIELLGGSISSAAKALNISYQAVSKWPDELSPAISDRVVAAVARSNPSGWAQVWPELKEQICMKFTQAQ